MSKTTSMRARRYLFAGVAVALVFVGMVTWWRHQEAPIARVESAFVSSTNTADSPLASTAVVASEVSESVETVAAIVVTPTFQPVASTSTASVVTEVSALDEETATVASPELQEPTPIEPRPLSSVDGTRLMYAAHAPLRVPEVANPDSEANRIILASMVQKALARSQNSQPRKNGPP